MKTLYISFLCLLLAAEAFGQSSPTLSLSNQTGIDNLTVTASGGITSNPSLYIYLNQPHGTFGGANDCLVVVAHASSTLFTFGTPSDNIGGDTYTAISGATGTQNGVLLQSWIVYGVPQGVIKITVPLTGSVSTSTMAYVGGWAQEFRNGCTSASGGAFLGFTANGSANNLTLGATPNSGDTVVAYAVDTQFPGTSSSCTGNAITFTAGWVRTGDSTCYGKAAELNSSTTSTNVPITFAGTNKIAMVGFIIAKGTAGTTPYGMYIDHEQAEQAGSGASPFTTQFPSSGNLLVVLYNDNTTKTLNSISVTNGGSPTTAVSTAVYNTNNNAELVQIAYAQNAALTPTTSVTLTLSAASTGINPEFLSITGAAASAFVKWSPGCSTGGCATYCPSGHCTVGAAGFQSTSGNTATDTITPSNTGDLLINEMAVDYHTQTGLVADSNSHTPAFLSAVDSAADNVGPSCNYGTPASTLAGDNGYSIFQTIDTSLVTFTYTGTQTAGHCTSSPAGVQEWTSVTAEFKAGTTPCPSSVPSGVTNCYFVSPNGLDTNSGTSESTPWLYSPGMHNYAGGHTLTGGDGIIFKGGNTWHFGNSSASPYTGVVTSCWGGGGTAGACWGALTPTSGSPIYFGVDSNWYTGTSWTRPVFTADNSPCNSSTLGTMPDGATCSAGTDPTGGGQPTYVVSSCPYQIGAGNDMIVFANSQNVYLDNLELTGICQNQVGQPGSQNIYILWNAASGPIYVENDYLHNMSHLQYQGSNGHASCTGTNVCFDLYAFNGNGNADGDGGVVTNTVVDFSDSDPAGQGICSPGTYMYDTHDSVFRYNSQCIPKGVHVMHDNLWEYYYENGHSNLWEDVETSPIGAIYNNVFRHMYGALVFWPGPSASTDASYFFSNLIYDVSTSQYFDYGGTGVQANGGKYYVFNNTFQSNGSSSTVIACAATSNVFSNLNNHFIDDISAYPGSCTGMTTTTPVSMSNSTATTDGYTSSQTYAYSPTVSGSPTVGVGTNEYSGYCSTLLGSADALIQAAGTACQSDTTYACSYNATNHTVSCPARTVNARPSSASWDVGAYQFGSGTPALGTPTPATLFTLVQEDGAWIP